MSDKILEWTEKEIETVAENNELWKRVLRPHLEACQEWGVLLPFTGRSGNNVVELSLKRGVSESGGKKRGRRKKGVGISLRLKEDGGDEWAISIDGKDLMFYPDTTIGKHKAAAAVKYLKEVYKESNGK